MVMSLKDSLLLMPHRIVHVGSACSSPLLPPKSMSYSSLELGKHKREEPGVEVKLDDFGLLQLSLAPKCHIIRLKVCHRCEGYNFILAPNQCGWCGLLKKKKKKNLAGHGGACL